MKRLGFLVLVASCATPPVPPGLPPQGVPSELARVSPEPPLHSEAVLTPHDSSEWLMPGLDAEGWPVGWVRDDEGIRLGLDGQFWSTRRLQWLAALDAAPATAAYRLERIYRDASGDEALRAAWRLWLIDSKAGLSDDARRWLDRAADLKPQPALTLERAWDQAFRLHDLWGARSLWSELVPGAIDDRKFRLLRQKLFLGTRSLAGAGADDYISSLKFDRDDLWAATWDGAVIRWSLVTGDVDLIRPASETVSPIRYLAVTGWFVYAFQDKEMLRYSKVAGSWRSFPYPAGWNGLRVQGAVAEGQETLWVGHLGEGLWKWNRGQWTLIDAGGGGPFINALASDGRGGLWIGTKDTGLWSWNSGTWSRVPAQNGAPANITVIEPAPDGSAWAVGSWGEGAWLLEGGVLRRGAGSGNEYITSAAWAGSPVWGTLDQGVFSASRSLGPLDGVPAGVSALAVWQGRWIWGTDQGLGWWSEDENTALSR